MIRLLPLLALGACVLDDRDLDGDGASGLTDCDDLDSTVFPGAVEILADGIDQNCDGVDVIRSVAGDAHRCDLDGDGQIACQGANDFGQLEVPSGREWTALAAGAFHTCALDRQGRVSCWGDNRFGQIRAPKLEGATQVDATDWASTAVVDDLLYCWGACVRPKSTL